MVKIVFSLATTTDPLQYCCTGYQLPRGTGPKPKADRQPIVNFINLHKLKVEAGYMCGFCSRVSADNSNMNRHIEVKHAPELEEYLASDQSSILS